MLRTARTRIVRGIDLRTKDTVVLHDTVYVNRLHTLIHICYKDFPDSWMRIRLPKRKDLRTMHDTLFEGFILASYRRFV
jgi:hypothetical protein